MEVEHRVKDKKDKKHKRDKKDKKDKKRKREDPDQDPANKQETEEQINGTNGTNGHSHDGENQKKRKRDSTDQDDDRETKKHKKDKKDKKDKKKKEDDGENGEDNEEVEGDKGALRFDGDFNKDNDQFEPINSFETLKPVIPKELMDYCKKFEKPTPIQSLCWPPLLANRDVIGIAETGSGKTLAFSLPILGHLLKEIKQNPEKFKKAQPSILILAPTRELAQQTADICEEMCRPCGLKSVCVYGGVPKEPQVKLFRGGINVVIGTPGRLIDLMNDGVCRLGGVNYLVLDEADRMLDLGFEQDIRKLIGACQKKRQTLMFSATWPESIQQLAGEFLNNPVKIGVGSTRLAANQNITQVVEVLEDTARDARLLQVLQMYWDQGMRRILIFATHRKEVDRLQRVLTSRKWPVVALSGDRGQAERTRNLAEFKGGNAPILVATDVAARGLDIPAVEAVIQFAAPLTLEDYVHRIGRTGRAGRTGIAHMFFTKFDKHHAAGLVAILKQTNQVVPQDLYQFNMATKKKEPKMGRIIDAPQERSGHVKLASDSSDSESD